MLDVGGGQGELGALTTAHWTKGSNTSINWNCIDVRRSERCTQFDGRRLPQANASADVVVFSYMLHHAGDHTISLLREAARVSRDYVVVVEDLKGETRRVAWNEFKDEWSGTFRGEEEWRELFGLLNLSLADSFTPPCSGGRGMPQTPPGEVPSTKGFVLRVPHDRRRPTNALLPLRPRAIPRVQQHDVPSASLYASPALRAAEEAEKAEAEKAEAQTAEQLGGFPIGVRGSLGAALGTVPGAGGKAMWSPIPRASHLPHTCMVAYDDRFLVSDATCFRVLASHPSIACPRGSRRQLEAWWLATSNVDREKCKFDVLALGMCASRAAVRLQPNLTLLATGLLKVSHFADGYAWPMRTERLDKLSRTCEGLANGEAPSRCTPGGVRPAPRRSAQWCKVQLMREALRLFPECELVGFIDSDMALLERDGRSVRPQLAQPQLAAFVRDPLATLFTARDRPKHGHVSLLRTAKVDAGLKSLWDGSAPNANLNMTVSNTGFMLIKRTPFASELLNRIWCWPEDTLRRGVAFGEPLSLYLTQWPHDQRMLEELRLQDAVPPGAVVHADAPEDYSRVWMQHGYLKQAHDFWELYRLARRHRLHLVQTKLTEWSGPAPEPVAELTA